MEKCLVRVSKQHGQEKYSSFIFLFTSLISNHGQKNNNYYYLIIIIPITLLINKNVHPIQIILNCTVRQSTYFLKIAVNDRHLYEIHRFSGRCDE